MIFFFHSLIIIYWELEPAVGETRSMQKCSSDFSQWLKGFTHHINIKLNGSFGSLVCLFKPSAIVHVEIV